jgi:hypothetical protein
MRTAAPPADKEAFPHQRRLKGGPQVIDVGEQLIRVIRLYLSPWNRPFARLATIVRRLATVVVLRSDASLDPGTAELRSFG